MHSKAAEWVSKEAGTETYSYADFCGACLCVCFLVAPVSMAEQPIAGFAQTSSPS